MQVDTHNPVQHKFHHDSRPYEVANKAAADKARAKLQARFESGRFQAMEVLKKLESDVPVDFLVPHDKINFDFEPNKGLAVSWPGTSDVPGHFDIHPHAFGQLLEKANIPKVYADRLLKEQPDLLVENLDRRYDKQAGKKFLARVVNGKLLGFLSDTFGRYDAAPMLTSFLATCKRYGAVPVEAKHLETRVYLKMMLPRIFEPIPNEILAFGAQFRTSDYADGALDVRLFLERTWCTNDAMAEEGLRKVHLGAKLTAENFSQETLQKQSEMLAFAIRDTVNAVFAPHSLEARLEIIKSAAEKNIPIKETLEQMRRNSKITKAEIERIQEMLTTSDVELLPPVAGLPPKGHTSSYRLANAFSLLAKDEDVDGYRAMDLEAIAGEIMGLMKPKTKKEEETEKAVEEELATV